MLDQDQQTRENAENTITGAATSKPDEFITALLSILRGEKNKNLS